MSARPRGRLCFHCGSQWVNSREVHRVTCHACGERLPPYCPNNDYHEVRPLNARPGKPLAFRCVNGCKLGRDGFTAKESADMRSARKSLSRSILGA
jgi:predicted  nucleic acid-binding Zn-ribbon protein